MQKYPYRILVISSCTSEKFFKPSNMLHLDDFKDAERMRNRQKELEEYMLKAGQMYTGKQHQYLLEGVKAIRHAYGHDSIDLKIISAGYGLLDENENIVPYNASFSDMNVNEIDEWSKQLQIREDIERIINNYDIVFFLLGEKYLRSLLLPFKNTINTKLVFMTTWTCSRLIPDLEHYWVIGSSKSDASSFGCALVSLKGFLFKLLALELANDVALVSKIYEDPDYMHCVLYPYRKDVESDYYNIFSEKVMPTCDEILMEVKQLSNNHQRKFGGFIVRDNDIADNYRAGKSFSFYIPEWDDRVDPNYDFKKDSHNREGQSPYEHDLYAHEIYPAPNYDGILVSIAVLDDLKKQAMYEKGVHNFLRFPLSHLIMADCGAFNYVAMDSPPYETSEVLDYYESFGFNYGVSIDHLIVDKYERDPAIRQYRFDLTLDNAKEFIKQHKVGGYHFKPVGVAQGWDPESYKSAVENLIDFGYEYVALGSLIPKTSRQIYNILKAISPIIPEYLDLHLFGITRLEGIKAFHKLGATSFDSSAPLRQAWLSARSNYYTMQENKAGDYSVNGYKRYAAVRIPFSNTKGLPEALANDLLKLEKSALAVIRLYEQNKVGLEKTLSTIIEYEKMNNEVYYEQERFKLEEKENRALNSNEVVKLGNKKNEKLKQIKGHEKLYGEVLSDRPWEQCDCVICRDLGIEVIIFRGNNRNRRRGFHNTYIFNKLFRRIIEN